MPGGRARSGMFIKVHDKHVRHALHPASLLSRYRRYSPCHSADLLLPAGEGRESARNRALSGDVDEGCWEKGVDMTDSACSASVSVHMIRETRACVTPELLRANPTDRVRV